MRLTGGPPDPLYVDARRVLLDVLEALAPHGEAVVLIDAQAVYLRTGEVGLPVAPYTTDADLALDPEFLLDEPELEPTLRAAGFQPDLVNVGRKQVGTRGVVDLMVPEAVGGAGRRGARLGVHGNRITRKGRGLEAALVDKTKELISALDPADRRQMQVWTAGSAALLVAKLHKVAERISAPTRSDDKDALDVYRLLQRLATSELAGGLDRCLANPQSTQVSAEAVGFLKDLFGDANATGCQMAARSLVPLADPDIVAASCAALAQDLIDAVEALGR